MTKRRDVIKALMAPVPTSPGSEEQSTPRSVASGSLKAMGLSLQSLTEEADEARALRDQIASGSHVVELDATLIDPSFVRDRLDGPSGEEFELFKARLAEDGQKIPILVRPHPNGEGRYQAAYGHRRLAALRALGRPVKAIVRNLTDEELIIAQGIENNDRRDLSFIERALFAARLEDRGFARSAVLSALSMHKGNLSTMISLVRSLPEELIVSIGAAPKIGRPRWEQLAALISRTTANWRELVSDAAFRTLDSNARFERVLKALSDCPPASVPEVVRTSDGTTLASIEHGKGRVRLTIENRSVADFGAYVVERLPAIYEAFLRRTDE